MSCWLVYYTSIRRTHLIDVTTNIYSSPYVTAVGATFLPYPRDAYIDAEVAVNRFPSGGGVSLII